MLSRHHALHNLQLFQPTYFNFSTTTTVGLQHILADFSQLESDFQKSTEFSQLESDFQKSTEPPSMHNQSSGHELCQHDGEEISRNHDLPLTKHSGV
jgi:hypothetical protein